MTSKSSNQSLWMSYQILFILQTLIELTSKSCTWSRIQRVTEVVAVEVIIFPTEYKQRRTTYMGNNSTTRTLETLITLLVVTREAWCSPGWQPKNDDNHIKAFAWLPYHVGFELLGFNIANIMVADALAPCVAKAPAPVILTMWIGNS